jgi:hypothetical protein
MIILIYTLVIVPAYFFTYIREPFSPTNTILLTYVSTSNVDMKSLHQKYTCNNHRKELL